MAGKHRLQADWDYRYTDLQVVSTILWSALDCQPQTADQNSMEPPLSDMAATCGGFESKPPPGLLRCTRCRAGCNYGQQGIREVLNPAKQMIVMAETEDTEYLGKDAAARAKNTSRRSRGVYSGLWRETRNQAKWRLRWEDSANLGTWYEEHVALMLSQGKTRFNQQRTSPPFAPTDEAPEPTLEWAVPQYFLGFRSCCSLRTPWSTRGISHSCPAAATMRVSCPGS